MDFLMAGQANPMMQFLPLMVIMFAVMYFLIIRPQKQKEKKRQAMMTNVRKQDRIITAGGVHGVVVSVKDSEVIGLILKVNALGFSRKF